MIRKILGYGLILMVALAIWRSSGGNIDGFVQTVWNLIESGAEFFKKLWDALWPIANDAVSDPNGGATPTPSATATP